MRDSYDRIIRYLRVSVTNRCNLNCVYCSSGSDCSGNTARPAGGVDALPLGSLCKIIEAAVELGVDKVRITGGEPLLREGLVEFVARLASLPGLSTLSMTTNGTLLAPAAVPLARAGLMSVNLSIDSVDEDEYRRLTGGGRLADALAGVEAALAAGMSVKLNTVIDADDGRAAERAAYVQSYARSIGAGFQRIRRYDPASPKLYDPAFDRPPPCVSCDRLRLLADGRMLACLHSSAWVKIDMDRIHDGILECVAMKPERGFSAVTAGLREIGG
jgi:cyclic pyranopterin phosphate synthase